MPAPAKTGRDRIVAAARDLLEEAGVEGVTMQAAAARVGVRAPSLYKHVRDRRALLDAVVLALLDELVERLEAVRDDDPGRRVAGQAEALRRFAHERPHGYALVFSTAPDAPRAGLAALARAAGPLLDAITGLTGPERALDGARLITAWATGFLAMELGGAFRLGGDPADAWAWGLRRILGSLDA